MRILLVSSLLCFTLVTKADTLTLLNWEEYLSEEVIQAWEKKSGHQLKQIYFDNDENRDQILINHKDQVIDLAVVDEVATRQFGEKQLFYPVSSFKETPNLKSIDGELQGSCSQYGVPYFWGTFGIVYRTDMVKTPPKSWRFLLSPEESMKGHIGWLDDYVDTLSPPLLLLEKSVNTADQAELKQAFGMLKELLPDILTFEYSVSYIENTAHGKELYAALGYSGDQYALNEKVGKEIWDYTTVNEGSVLWVDCLVVMNDSPRKSIAMDFLNFIFDPTIAAQNSEEIYVATTSSQAKSLQTKEFLEDETVYPPAELMNKAQRYEFLTPDNILLRNRVTSSLLKLHESK